MLSLQLLGGCSLRCNGEIVSGPAVQPRRLALFALAAGHRTAGLSRDKAVAYFWPEEDREHARHFLADSLFTIRKCSGMEIFVPAAGDIRLNPQVITVDLWDFEDACALNDSVAAVKSYRGPFLDGFFVRDAPEFERWADGERDRLNRMYGVCLERFAVRCEESGDHPAAADLWLRLSTHDPYSSRIAIRTMLALENAGDRAGALQHALKHERTVRADLDISPDSAVVELAQRLRTTAGHSIELPPERRDIQLRMPVASVRRVFEPHHPARSKRGTRTAFRIFALCATALAVADGSARKSTVPGAGDGLATQASAQNQARTAREEAEELYHRARLTQSTGPNPGPTEQVLALYRQALKRDPTFAAAYAGIADAYGYRKDYVRAKEAALTALAMDSTLAEGHTALAYVLAYSEHRWLAADSALERATRLSPRFVHAYMRRAYIAATLGRREDALRYLERARALEPESWMVLLNRAIIEARVGKLSEAIEHFEEARELDPSRKDVQILLARTLWNYGRRKEAETLFRSNGAVAEAAVAAQDTVEMKELLSRYNAGDLRIDPCQAAMLYVGIGDNDDAFRELRKSRDISLLRHLREPPLKWLEHDPRFSQVLADWGLPSPSS